MFKKIEILLMIIIFLFVIWGNYYFYKLSQKPITRDDVYKYCVGAYYYKVTDCMRERGFNLLQK